MQMIDVLTKLREIADRSPEEIGRAIAAAEKMSGQAPVSEASEAQKAAREKFKNMLKGKKGDDDKDDDKKSESSGKKPDFLDMDKDGDKKEPMTKALKDKEDKKVDEDVQITLSGSDAVLAEILKLAGQIGAKTTKGADAGPSMPGSPGGMPALPPPPPPSGMPSSGPIPSLASMLGDKPDHMDGPMGGPDHMDGPMGGPDHMDGPMGGGMEDELLGDSFNAATTTPNPRTMGLGSAVPSGNDLAKPKVTTPMTSPGNNPLHTAISFD
jgi:hypothetical protein